MKQININRSTHDFVIASMRKTCSHITVSYGRDGHVIHILTEDKNLSSFSMEKQYLADMVLVSLNIFASENMKITVVERA